MTEVIQTAFWRKEAKKRVQTSQPTQKELFSSRKVAQFGVNPKPTLPIQELTTMRLTAQDNRTEEEKNQLAVETHAAGEFFVRGEPESEGT